MWGRLEPARDFSPASRVHAGTCDRRDEAQPEAEAWFLSADLNKSGPCEGLLVVEHATGGSSSWRERDSLCESGDQGFFGADTGHYRKGLGSTKPTSQPSHRHSWNACSHRLVYVSANVAGNS